jgi:hypothetical protein
MDHQVAQGSSPKATPEDGIRELLERVIKAEYAAVAFGDSRDFDLVNAAYELGLPLDWICEQVVVLGDDEADEVSPPWTWSDGKDALEALVSSRRRAVVKGLLERHGGAVGLHAYLWNVHRGCAAFDDDDPDADLAAFGTIPEAAVDGDFGSPILMLANVEQLRGYEWIVEGLPAVAEF